MVKHVAQRMVKVACESLPTVEVKVLQQWQHVSCSLAETRKSTILFLCQRLAKIKLLDLVGWLPVGKFRDALEMRIHIYTIRTTWQISMPASI